MYKKEALERVRQVYVSEEMYSAIVYKCVMYSHAMDGADKRGAGTGGTENRAGGTSYCRYR